jgi:hypothetical protein
MLPTEQPSSMRAGRRPLFVAVRVRIRDPARRRLGRPPDQPISQSGSGDLNTATRLGNGADCFPFPNRSRPRTKRISAALPNMRRAKPPPYEVQAKAPAQGDMALLSEFPT